MLGILIISHGDLAKGMLHSAKMFFGEHIENIDTLSLTLDMAVEDFQYQLNEKINQLNQGDGVLILADLFGGTPCNQASLLAREDVHVISGANLTMLLEILGYRENENISELVSIGQNGIRYINEEYSEPNTQASPFDDLF